MWGIREQNEKFKEFIERIGGLDTLVGLCLDVNKMELDLFNA